MGDFLLGIQREQMAFGSVFFVSRAVARGSETLKRVPQQIWCQKNATFSSCPFWYIYTQSLTERELLKNKGSQTHKKGPKRPKYQSTWPEHPATARIIAETDIHANHAEAFFSALRRKCATFRRKTNMYAKSTTGLQRLLRVYWVVHNFL